MNNAKPLFACVLTAWLMIEARSQQPQPATAPTPKPKWDRSVALGATLTDGNSDTLLATAQILAARKWDKHELSLGADAAYGEVEDVKNADMLHGFAQYNRLFTERFYGYARLEGLHDAIADVEYRFTLSPGVGYYLIKRPSTTLSVEGGPAFIAEKVGPDEKEYVALRLAEKFEHKFSERARVWQMVEFLPQIDNFDNYIVNAEVGAEAELAGDLKLRVYAQDTYDNEPAPGREKNDVKLVSALAYTF